MQLHLLLSVFFSLSQTPSLAYRLESTGKSAVWEVTVTGTGFDPAAGPISLSLNDWGDWRGVDSLFFRLLSIEPASAAAPTAALPPFTLTSLTPEGGFQVRYSLRLTLLGSGAQQALGLLPFHGPNYEYGQTRNVFLAVQQGGAPTSAAVSVELLPPEGAEVFSGWAGRSAGPQRAAVDPSAWNGLFAFGKPKAARQFGSAQSPVLVWQLGAARDVSDTVGSTIEALVGAMGAAMGRPGPNPLRVFIHDASSGGMAAEQGFVIGYPADTPDFHQFSPYFAQTIAHELFHNWLGITVPASEEIAWFHEGFTDYLALWFMATTSTCQRTWFADRLLELETAALSESALGSVSFADPGSGWRDGNGRMERMAYQGGALLAFRLDVELRAAGRAGLPKLVGDFLREGGATSLERIRAWITAQGLPDFYDDFIAGAALPEVAASLERAGFRLENRAVPLTYLGLQAEGEGLGARIVRVDEDGPAAQAGIRAGDVVRGYSPTRDGTVVAEGELATSFRFGLALFEPAAKSVQLWLDRDGVEIEVRIVPRPMSGGLERRTADPGASLDPFFRFAPPADEPR